MHNHTPQLLPAATGSVQRHGELAHRHPAGNHLPRGIIVLAAAVLLHEIVRVVCRVVREPNRVFQRESREAGGRKSRNVLDSERRGRGHVASVSVHRDGRRGERYADRAAVRRSVQRSGTPIDAGGLAVDLGFERAVQSDAGGSQLG